MLRQSSPITHLALYPSVINFNIGSPFTSVETKLKCAISPAMSAVMSLPLSSFRLITLIIIGAIYN